jgi:hypothetical protein
MRTLRNFNQLSTNALNSIPPRSPVGWLDEIARLGAYISSVGCFLPITRQCQARSPFASPRWRGTSAALRRRAYRKARTLPPSPSIASPASLLVRFALASRAASAPGCAGSRTSGGRPWSVGVTHLVHPKNKTGDGVGMRAAEFELAGSSSWPNCFRGSRPSYSVIDFDPQSSPAGRRHSPTFLCDRVAHG